MNYYLIDTAGRFFDGVGFRTYCHHDALKLSKEKATSLKALHKNSEVTTI
ncbi:TPA: hypothetical protein ACPVZG_004170 [Vibrio parahaemolyticus]